MNYVEKMITRKIAEALLDKRPFEAITVCSERGYDPDAKHFPDRDAPKQMDRQQMIDGIVAEANEFDEVHIFVGGSHTEGYGPWVYLIFGNGNGGWDMISDYFTSLEPVLQPVIDFIEKESD